MKSISTALHFLDALSIQLCFSNNNKSIWFLQLLQKGRIIALMKIKNNLPFVERKMIKTISMSFIDYRQRISCNEEFKTGFNIIIFVRTMNMCVYLQS